MCGIAGTVAERPVVFEAARLRAVLDMLRHRGPDGEGWLCIDGPAVRRGAGRDGDLRGEVLLIHTRLSIIDLSDRGSQPMSSADERFHLVFNGEIYNYVELRRELQALGHRFRSHSDTEVLLEAWREWGAETLRRVIGMFAFALVDRHEQMTYFARDPFGIKPLFIASPAPGQITFASEIRALFALGGLSRNVNPQGLYEFLRFGLHDHGSETFFRDVSQLRPAHYARVPVGDPGRIEHIRYWEPPDREQGISLERAAERLRELFLRNIELHLRSDVPVGVAFSGGIDSAANVCAIRAVGGEDIGLHTFSYIADDKRLSEERWVDLVTAAKGSIAHKIRPTPAQLAADLDDLIDTQAEPFPSTSIYAQYRVFQLAHERGVKVMLDGQGADELFAGYRGYVSTRVASLVRSLRLIQASRLLRAIRANPNGTNERLWFALALPAPLRAPLRRLVGGQPSPPGLGEEWFLAHDVHMATPGVPDGHDMLRAQLVDSLCETSVPALLRYEDRNSMRFSVESRVPFLTTELAEFALSLPPVLLIGDDASTKRVLRAALRGLVPDPVLDRRDKIGFETPEGAWLRALRPWVDDTLAEASGSMVGPIRVDEARGHWQQVSDGNVTSSGEVWRWLSVIRWTERLGVTYA